MPGDLHNHTTESDGSVPVARLPLMAARVGAVLAARARSPYGARELRRQVDRAVEQALANQIASGTAHTGQHWTADCTVDGAIVLEEGEVVEQTIG